MREKHTFNLRKLLNERFGDELRYFPVAFGLLLLFIFFSIQSDVFFTSRNINNLLIHSTVTGIIALGLVFVLLVGEIDLSVAATSGVASVLMSKLIVDFGIPIPISIFLGICSGVLVGMISGRWVTLIGVPSFVVTLGVGMLLNGIQLLLLPRTGRYNLLNTGVDKIAATYISGFYSLVLVIMTIIIYSLFKFFTLRSRLKVGLSTSYLQDFFIPLGFVSFFLIGTYLFLINLKGIPMPVIIFLFLLFISSYIANNTKFGLSLYAIGNNIEGARRAGINVNRIKLLAFAIAGGFSACAGILAASRILGVSVSSGGGIGGGSLLLESIAAAVIGGVSLFGGRGKIIGALFGALIIATVSNGLNLMGVGNELKLVVTGLLLILAVSADKGLERFTNV